MRHGKGLVHHINGTRTDGEWFKDKLDGVGIEILEDGSLFKGNYISGMK